MVISQSVYDLVWKPVEKELNIAWKGMRVEGIEGGIVTAYEFWDMYCPIQIGGFICLLNRIR